MSVRPCRRAGCVSLVRKRGACLVEGIDGEARVVGQRGQSMTIWGRCRGRCLWVCVGADGSLVRERRDVSATWCWWRVLVRLRVDSSLVRERGDCLVEAFDGKRKLLSGQQVLLVGDSQQQYYL